MEVLSLNAVKLQGLTPTLSKKVEDITVKPVTDSTGGQNSLNEANSYNKYDTLELSQDYLEYRTKTESSTITSDSNQLDSTVEQKVPRMPPQEIQERKKPVDQAETESPSTVTDDSEEDVSSAQLSSYSTAELKGLLQQGKITTADYNAEVKSRQDNTNINPLTNIIKELTTLQSNQQKINQQNIQTVKRPSNSIF